MCVCVCESCFSSNYKWAIKSALTHCLILEHKIVTKITVPAYSVALHITLPFRTVERKKSAEENGSFPIRMSTKKNTRILAKNIFRMKKIANANAHYNRLIEENVRLSQYEASPH